MNPFNVATFLVLTALGLYVITTWAIHRWIDRVWTSRSIPSCWKQLQLRFRPNRAQFVIFGVLFFQPLLWFNVYYIYIYIRYILHIYSTYILHILYTYFTGMTLSPQLYGDWIPGSLISVICISWFLSYTDLGLEDVASVKKGCATLGGEETSYV